MLDRAAPLLRALSLGLIVLLVFQLAAIARRRSPLKRTAVPEPATWSPPGATNATNQAASPGAPPPGMPPGMPRGMGGPGRPGGPGGPSTLPPEVQARVDRVIQSELLGMIMRPPPMALLGIVGNDVLLRAPNGMSGLVREGAELGGVKILRIGTNRVLVKVDGAEQELTIFNGIGGDSLLSTNKQGTP